MTGARVTVVIPMRDEAATISGCLQALAVQDFPHELVDVLLVDGGSRDETATIAARLLGDAGWRRAEVLHNRRTGAGDRPSNLNRGLAETHTPYLCRVDARSRPPVHYLRTCVELLDARPDVAVVGGRQRASSGSGAVATGIARALNNRWGTGLARYRRATRSGMADTVYLGTYRTDQLRAGQGWSGRLPVNEDFDLHRRLRRFGAVWFEKGLVVDYVPRATFGDLARQYWGFGTAKARYWRLSGDRPRPRQVLLLTAPVAALGVFVGILAGFGPAVAGLLLVAAMAGGMVLEAAGADSPRAGLGGHLAALAAMGCLAGAWLAGVAYGTLRPAPGPVPAGGRPLERAA